MYRHNKKTLKGFLYSEYENNEELFSKRTVNGLLRSLLEPIAANNAKSLIFTRFKNTNGIEGIIKRLEYCSNVEMYSFLDYDNILKDDFVETEFVIITSQRYNAVLIWDYSDSKDKNETKLYIRLNSKDVNEVFETVKTRLKVNLDDKFYSFRPERRENALLNDAVYNVLKMLNENIKENEFNSKEQELIANKLDVKTDKTQQDTSIRHCCHEIKNQLSVIDIYAKILEKQFGDDQNIALIQKSVSLIRLQLDDLRASVNINFKEKKQDVDKIIKELAFGWDIDRLFKIDKDILRIAIIELVFMKDAPHKVVIDEALELAKKYSTDDSPSFINGILAKVVERYV